MIISSITFGAFRSISDGNKRNTCQSNLAQIYQSCRLYAQDYEGEFPYFYPDPAPLGSTPPPAPSPAANRGLGLWALYTYRDGNSNDCPSTPSVPYTPNLPPVDSAPSTLTGYVRSLKVFHCPNDDYKQPVTYRDASAACTTTEVQSSQLTFSDADGNLRRNPSYLSYQNKGDNDPALSVPPHDTYTSYRGNGVKRQLDYYSGGTIADRPIADLTVVTWCRFHRSLDRVTGATTTVGKRNYDNVLFSDGSVQYLPASQSVSDSDNSGTATGTCLGWQRVPRGKADSMKDPTTCTP